MLKVDLILHNGRIYPDVKSRTRFEAIAIWRGRVTELGTDRKILRQRGTCTALLNLQGSVVLPGFCDSHIHLLNYGMLLRTLDLSKTKSIEEIERLVANAGSTKRNNGWILGRGWDDERLQDHRYPNRDDLDRASENPVFLKRICGHVAIANSKALALSGIRDDTPDPEGGVIVRDYMGRPNGVLKERAIELVENAVPESSDETRKVLLLASKRLVRLGITSLHCIISDLGEFVALRRLKRDGKIPQSIYAIIPLNLLSRFTELGLATERGSADFRIGGVKLFLDGSLGAHTAALTTCYSDDPTTSGILTMNKEKVQVVASNAKQAGFQLCVHAIGDRAVDLAIHVIEALFSEREATESRHRIEHASLISMDSIRKMSSLGIIASVQPRFIYSDSWAKERLGSRRADYLYPYASFNEQRVVMAAGSDCPVEDPNPFEGIWAAVSRPGLNSHEALNVSQALAAYTANAAYASFCEDIRGTLEPGKMADMVVVDRDPFEASPEDIRQTKVLKTIIAGKVYV